MKKFFILCLAFLSWMGCSTSGSESNKSLSVLPTSAPSTALPYEKLNELSAVNLGSWSAFVSPPLPGSSIKESERELFHLVLDNAEPFRKQILDFQEWIEGQGFRLVRKKRVKKKLPQKVILEFQKGQRILLFEIDQKVLAKVALVIDDLGHNKRALPYLQKINRPMTLAILPHLAYSEILSRELHQQGYEVILHLPMENTSGLDPGPGAVNTKMEEGEIRQSIDKALKSVPEAVGANNHMGSKATQDLRVMEIVLDELKDRDLIFLDSLTAASVTSEAAAKEGIEIHSRDVFLDNEDDMTHISGQLQLLKKQALRHGEAIGIGHFKEKTLQAIQEAIDDFEESGIELVFLSEFYGRSKPPAGSVEAKK